MENLSLSSVLCYNKRILHMVGRVCSYLRVSFSPSYILYAPARISHMFAVFTF